MFNLRRVFAFWATVASILGSVGWAEAQSVTITIPPTGVQRPGQDGGGKVPLTQINYSDCLDNDTIRFTVSLGAGYANYPIEVWAGDACDVRTSRIGGIASCWNVHKGQPINISYSFDTKVRDILYGRTGGTNIGAGGSGGTSGTGGSDSTGGTGGSEVTAAAGADDSTGGTTSSVGASGNTPQDAPSACVATSAAVAPQSLTVWILLLDSASNPVGTASWKATYKLTSSAPPDSVTSGTGENIAPISWTYNSTTSGQYTSGYQLYCDPAPGQSGLEEAGVTVNPNMLPACGTSDILIPGTRPADKYKCGTADKNALRGNATGLVNNVAYNVAVATTDTYRNVGVISKPACAIPQPVTGFFEAYRDAGGEGGGGFCSFSRQGRPVVIVTLFGLALCLVLRRRRAT